MAVQKIAPYAMPTEHDLPATGPVWRMDPARVALLIHDMQNYFLAPFQQNTSPVSELVRNIGRLRDWADAQDVPVIYTAQPPDQRPADRRLLTDFWGPGLRDERSAAIVDELAPADRHTVLTKWRYSAFQRSNLLELLRQRGRDQLLITGVYAHIGCQVTACDAFMYDIQPFLPADALGDFSPDRHQQALAWVAERCGTVTSTERVLAESGEYSRSSHG